MELAGGHLLLNNKVVIEGKTKASVGCLMNKKIKNKMNKWRAISERPLLLHSEL